MMRTKTMWSAIILVLLGLVLALVCRSIRNHLPLPLWLKHTLDLCLQPPDLYDPIVKDNFRFTEQGFSKSYTLHPRYADFYEAGFMDPAGKIPVSYKFSWVLQFNLSCQGRIMKEETVRSMGPASFADSNLDYYTNIALFEFPIPLQARCSAPVLTVTVLKVDEQLKTLKVPPQLYVAVSATP